MALMPNIDQDLTHCVTTAIIWSLHNNSSQNDSKPLVSNELTN